jgi:8-oxo-dGTP pyrophosphatase MutT (NUDIX family)
MSSRDESVTIVDLDNRLVGTASRGVMRHFHLPHRATYVLVLNGKSEVFVHKRTGEKDIYPGYYCPVFGGVVAAGESYEEAAIRELAEEAGIRDVPLQTLFDFYHGDPTNRVWGRAFLCRYDGELILQPEEIESGAFMSVPATLALAGRKPFTPDGLHVLQRLAEQLPFPSGLS